MDESLRTFFNRVHSILGMQTQEARDRALNDFERTVAERGMLSVLSQLSEAQREKYGTFLESVAESSAEESAKFLESLCGRGVIEKTFQEVSARYAQEYMQKMLASASEAQRQEVKQALEELKK